MGAIQNKATPTICVLQTGRPRSIPKKNRRIIAHKPRGWRIVVQDESIFIYEVCIRSVWAVKGSKPIILTTGSHKRSAVFGAYADNGTQLFRTYSTANSDAFLDYLKQLHRKHPKMILYIDKAPWHKEERVLEFLKSNKNTIQVIWFPSGFPEANPMEECWNQGKNEVGSHFHDTHNLFTKELSKYYRTKRFKLKVSKYLCH